MKLTTSGTPLTPEQLKAFNLMKDYFIDRSNIEYLTTPPKKMFTTNYIAYTDRFHLRKGNLPTELTWSWNQSNKKVFVELGAGKTVSIQKMNPRRKKNVSSSPSYKLWIFILSEKGLRDVEFLWCAKGVPTYNFVPMLTPPASTCNSLDADLVSLLSLQEVLSVDDFAFLRDFTDISTATDLGWF